jgi:hypothetical protein
VHFDTVKTIEAILISQTLFFNPTNLSMKFVSVLFILGNAFGVSAFPISVTIPKWKQSLVAVRSSNLDSKTEEKAASTPPRPNDDDDYLGQTTMGGYTVKQRLREEVESPFRKVRLVFFGSSAGSALTALYFSGLNTIKAVVGGYQDAMPLDEALTNDAINIGAAIICSYLAYRDYQAGQVNLERISRGGKLASLVVEPAAGGNRLTLASYRRSYRVLIAAGGPEYIAKLARSMNADQLQDSNILPEKLQETDVMVVPVLLKGGSGAISVTDTMEAWQAVEAVAEEGRNFDITRSDKVIAFPKGTRGWTDYLESEIKTAEQQGFDVMEKGITLIVKKNGKILRRATGLPPWGDLIGTMEVLDGTRFGMPGDSEKYGGP